MNMTDTVKHLIIINVLFFVCANFGLLPHANDLFALYYFENDKFRWYQILTHMFMHAPFPNVMHIAFNMFALYSFGTTLEQLWGGKKFLFFYISCGLGAALVHTAMNYYQIHSLLREVASLNLSKAEIHTLMNLDPRTVFDETGHLLNSNVKSMLERVHCSQEQFDIILQAYQVNQVAAVGASGAIYGLLVAFAVMFPTAELALMFIPVPIKAKYFIPGLLAVDLFLGFRGSSIFGAGGTGIAHFAHIGGALFGFIIMWVWKKNQFNKNRWN